FASLNVPVPLIHSTLLDLNRNETPCVVCFTTAAFHAFTFANLRCKSSSLTPSFSNVSSACSARMPSAPTPLWACSRCEGTCRLVRTHAQCTRPLPRTARPELRWCSHPGRSHPRNEIPVWTLFAADPCNSTCQRFGVIVKDCRTGHDGQKN